MKGKWQSSQYKVSVPCLCSLNPENRAFWEPYWWLKLLMDFCSGLNFMLSTCASHLKSFLIGSDTLQAPLCCCSIWSKAYFVNIVFIFGVFACLQEFQNGISCFVSNLKVIKISWIVINSVDSFIIKGCDALSYFLPVRVLSRWPFMLFQLHSLAII